MKFETEEEFRELRTAVTDVIQRRLSEVDPGGDEAKRLLAIVPKFERIADIAEAAVKVAGDLSALGKKFIAHILTKYGDDIREHVRDGTPLPYPQVVMEVFAESEFLATIHGVEETIKSRLGIDLVAAISQFAKQFGVPGRPPVTPAAEAELRKVLDSIERNADGEVLN